MRAAAQTLGMTLQSVEIRGPEDFDTAFSAMTREGADALIAFSDPLIVFRGRQIADLAAKSRLPAVYASREVVDAGGLMSYGPSIVIQYGHQRTRAGRARGPIRLRCRDELDGSAPQADVVPEWDQGRTLGQGPSREVCD
jgi:hypothetical protein